MQINVDKLSPQRDPIPIIDCDIPSTIAPENNLQIKDKDDKW